MSIITYNNVTLPYAFLTRFDQQTVYEDVGHTDWYLTRFDIEAQSVLNSNYLSLLGLANVTTNPADIMNAVREALSTPRRALSVKFNGVDLIPNGKREGGFLDAQNGPKPQRCAITQLTDTTFLIQWHCIANFWENNKIGAKSPVVSTQPGNPVLFNRWTETVSIDELGYSTRNRNGKFGIRSDNPEKFIADQLRSQMAVTGIPKGFLRKSSRYTVTPDGLAIQYDISDVEQFKMPPAPAFKAEGTYTESTTKMGTLRYADVMIRLWAGKQPNITQAKLIETAIAVAHSKLHVRGQALGGGGANAFTILENASLAISMYANDVTYRVRAMAASDNQRINGIVAFTGPGLTFTPGSDGFDNQPAYQDRGTASLLLQAAAYYDPSLRNLRLDRKTNQMTARG